MAALVYAPPSIDVHVRTFPAVSELPADYLSLGCTPEVITDGPPHLIIAHLHTALSESGSTHKSQVTIITDDCMGEVDLSNCDTIM